MSVHLVLCTPVCVPLHVRVRACGRMGAHACVPACACACVDNALLDVSFITTKWAPRRATAKSPINGIQQLKVSMDEAIFDDEPEGAPRFRDDVRRADAIATWTTSPPTITTFTIRPQPTNTQLRHDRPKKRAQGSCRERGYGRTCKRRISPSRPNRCRTASSSNKTV